MEYRFKYRNQHSYVLGITSRIEMSIGRIHFREFIRFMLIPLPPHKVVPLFDLVVKLKFLFLRCYSNVGRRHGMQKVSIGSGCYRVGTPIHELMHVLGFFHEMARPDRDESVVIHWENIKEGIPWVISENFNSYQ